MKRNPLLVFLSVVGLFFLIFLVGSAVLLFALFGDKPSILKSEAIGVIKIEGIITKSEPVLKLIQDYKDEKHIKAVIVRIDSPGGVVGPSQEIYQALKELKTSKKVVASMGTLGASGAYYIACAADQIVANPGTLTGSIGVMMEFANLQKLYQWAKLDHVVLKSGRFKDMGSPLRPMNQDEKALLDQLIQNIYTQFKNVVLEERRLTGQHVDEITDGRVFSGEQAKSLGLVDQLGNFRTAVTVAKELAGLKGEPELVYPPAEKRSLLRFFLGESVLQTLDTIAQHHASPLLYLMPVY